MTGRLVHLPIRALQQGGHEGEAEREEEAQEAAAGGAAAGAEGGDGGAAAAARMRGLHDRVTSMEAAAAEGLVRRQQRSRGCYGCPLAPSRVMSPEKCCQKRAGELRVCFSSLRRWRLLRSAAAAAARRRRRGGATACSAEGFTISATIQPWPLPVRHGAQRTLGDPRPWVLVSVLQASAQASCLPCGSEHR